MPDGEELDTTALEQAVDKVTTEEVEEEATTSKEETKPETSTETDTPKEETAEEEGKEKVKEEETEEDTRFDKHPRWQKLMRERDEALQRAEEARDLKEKIGSLSPDDILRLSQAGKLLQKYPELAKQVQETLDKYPYGTAEFKTEIDKIKSEQAQFRQEQLLEKYDKSVNDLITQYKVDKDTEDLVREMLDNRVIRKGISDIKEVSKEFEGLMKDIDKFRRKTLASHIEDKKKLPNVPASAKERGKVMTTKKESTEPIDIVNELADGLKSASSQTVEE